MCVTAEPSPALMWVLLMPASPPLQDIIQRGQKVTRVCWSISCLFDWLTRTTLNPIIKITAAEGSAARSAASESFTPPCKKAGLKPSGDVHHKCLFVGSSSYLWDLKEKGQWGGGTWLWGSKTKRGEGAGSQWRLFCSHESVSERTPMQLCQLALPSFNPPKHTHPHTHMSILLWTPNLTTHNLFSVLPFVPIGSLRGLQACDSLCASTSARISSLCVCTRACLFDSQ